MDIALVSILKVNKSSIHSSHRFKGIILFKNQVIPPVTSLKFA